MKKTKEQRRKLRVRSKIQGTKNMPRLSVFRSNNYIYAQLIDDEKKETILGMSEQHLEKKSGSKLARSKQLGLLLSKKAIEKKIKKVVFDRGSYIYHGRIKALAQAAREGGLEF